MMFQFEDMPKNVNRHNFARQHIAERCSICSYSHVQNQSTGYKLDLCYTLQILWDKHIMFIGSDKLSKTANAIETNTKCDKHWSTYLDPEGDRYKELSTTACPKTKRGDNT